MKDRNQFEFKNEMLLRQAIAGLLSKMPRISGVQILHGALEFGKDIVFNQEGVLDESIACAAVVKNKPISGNVESTGGARTVLQQVEQALDTPFLDKAGQEVYARLVYVFCPDEITQAGLFSIRGKLKSRVGQVVFKTGQELFDLFLKYWPDFLAHEVDALSGYLEGLARDMPGKERLERVLDLYNVTKDAGLDPELYIPVQFSRRFYKRTPAEIISQSLFGAESLRETMNPTEVQSRIVQLKRLGKRIVEMPSWGLLQRQAGREVTSKIEELAGNLEREFDRYDKEVTKQIKMGKAEKDIKKEVHLQNFIKMHQMHSEITRLLDSVLAEADLGGPQIFGFRPNEDVIKREIRDIASSNACRRTMTAYNYLEHFGIVSRDEEPTVLCDFGDDPLREYSTNVLIVAPPGYGKTTYCRWHALRDAANFRTRKGRWLPIYVPLHQLAGKPVSSFEIDFLGRKALSAFSESKTKPTARRTKTLFRLYLDGLDEIPNESERQSIIDTVKDGIQRRNDCAVVITARDVVSGLWLEWLPRISVSGFAASEQRELPNRLLKGDSAVLNEFWRQLESLPGLKALMAIPLLATLTVLTFKQTRRLPGSRARLYSAFCDLLLGGWDLAKGVLRGSKFTREVKLIVLSRVAASVHEEEKRTFTGDAVGTAAVETLNKFDKDEEKELVKELLQDGLLTGTGDLLYFSHHSFQEFLTAYSYSGDANFDRIREAVNQFMKGKDWMKEVIGFYIGLSRNPSTLADSIYQMVLQNYVGNKVDEPVTNRRARDIYSYFRDQFPDILIAEGALWAKSQSDRSQQGTTQ